MDGLRGDIAMIQIMITKNLVNVIKDEIEKNAVGSGMAIIMGNLYHEIYHLTGVADKHPIDDEMRDIINLVYDDLGSV